MKLRFTVLLLLLSLHSLAASAATLQLPQTGQTTCYDAAGAVITCAGTGQDGAKQMGVAWPNPRFTDNSNGTITDNLTGLIWMKDGNCTATLGGIDKSGGKLSWANALTWSNSLVSGSCGLTDGSTAGSWRLPNINELESQVNGGQVDPSIWLNGQGFSNVQSSYYWSSTTSASLPDYAWYVYFYSGFVSNSNKYSSMYVRCVRGGQ